MKHDPHRAREAKNAAAKFFHIETKDRRAIARMCSIPAAPEIFPRHARKFSPPHGDKLSDGLAKKIFRDPLNRVGPNPISRKSPQVWTQPRRKICAPFFFELRFSSRQ